MFKWVNCTPHEVVILRRQCVSFDQRTMSYRLEGEPVVGFTMPVSGHIARCEREDAVIGDMDGIPVVTTRFGKVTGLPKPEDGTEYIVSNIVAQALPDRRDLVVPAWLVRDKAGAIVGCLAFSHVG